MRLIDMRGGYLYQHRPDICPEGRLTEEEHTLWVAYFERKAAEHDSRG